MARVAEAFAAEGHELALVGGPVRDAFLGHAVHDLDFTTSARPDDILSIVAPIAEAHWDIGRAFGTIGARVAGETVEITTYRSDSYDGVSRKPEVEFGESLEGDLVRRDFTVNAMALRLPEVVLVDPSGGVEDLLAGRLRTPPSPTSRSATTPSGCCGPPGSPRSSASARPRRSSGRWPSSPRGSATSRQSGCRRS